jgi:hypothetical protein
MEDWELREYIGKKIRYDICPHPGQKKHLEGIGVLDYYEPHDFWQILAPDGQEIHLPSHWLAQIENDREQDGRLSFVYSL